MVDFKIEVHLASTEMQRVPSLVEEKYLGAAIWVRRPTESALNILVTISSSCQFFTYAEGCDGIGSGWCTGGLGWVSIPESGSQDGGAVSGGGGAGGWDRVRLGIGLGSIWCYGKVRIWLWVRTRTRLWED